MRNIKRFEAHSSEYYREITKEEATRVAGDRGRTFEEPLKRELDAIRREFDGAFDRFRIAKQTKIFDFSTGRFLIQTRTMVWIGSGKEEIALYTYFQKIASGGDDPYWVFTVHEINSGLDRRWICDGLWGMLRLIRDLPGLLEGQSPV